MKETTAVGESWKPHASWRLSTAIRPSFIDVIVETNKASNVGDSPLPLAFSSKREFWILMFWSGLLGGLMGLIDAGFLNAVDQIPKEWASCDYSTNVACGDYYSGRLWWIAVVSVAGCFVGVLEWWFEVPKDVPGIYQEIHECEGNIHWAVVIFFQSCISLSGGAALGPEQAIGGLGAGLGQWLGAYLNFSDETDKKMLVLAGIAGAMGGLFPTPVLAGAMIFELSNPPKPYTEAMIVLFWSALISWCVFYPLSNASYIGLTTTEGIAFADQWIDLGFQESQVLVGVVIGLISAGAGFAILLVMGISKQVFIRIRQRLSFSTFLQAVVPPIIGGIIIGTVNWAMPLTVGRGNIQASYIIQFGGQSSSGVTITQLVATAFARVFLLGVSVGCGFKGGLFFAIISIGNIAGAISYRVVPYLPYGLMLSCFTSAIAASIAPMPIALAGISWFVFFLGVTETIPVFVACITSYCALSGCGILQTMVARRAEREEEEEKKKHPAGAAAAPQYGGKLGDWLKRSVDSVRLPRSPVGDPIGPESDTTASQSKAIALHSLESSARAGEDGGI